MFSVRGWAYILGKAGDGEEMWAHVCLVLDGPSKGISMSVQPAGAKRDRNMVWRCVGKVFYWVDLAIYIYTVLGSLCLGLWYRGAKQKKSIYMCRMLLANAQKTLVLIKLWVASSQPQTLSLVFLLLSC